LKWPSIASSPRVSHFLNRAAGERGTVEIGVGFKVENLRDKGVQENLIREYLTDYEPTEEMLDVYLSLTASITHRLRRPKK
jgi:hypothetical protein